MCTPFLERNGLSIEDVDHLIFHPGGKKIVQTIEELFGSLGKNIDNTKAVLKQFGNMSSATVLYVLERFMDEGTKKEDIGLMLSFGPGFYGTNNITEMVREFEGKNEWAIILGASSGLGLATAKKLADEGLNICLVYRARKSDFAAIETEFETIASTRKVKLLHFNMDVVKPENREAILIQLKQTLQEIGKVKMPRSQHC